MGAAAEGEKGLKERTRESGERPIGTARCRPQYNPASRQRCPPPPGGSGGGDIQFRPPAAAPASIIFRGGRGVCVMDQRGCCGAQFGSLAWNRGRCTNCEPYF